METSLLATKLFIPKARPGLVPRPRLMARLEAAFTCRLTLVSAQAGYGKSTVLAQWISENRPPGGTAWVSLDEGDNDPVRFWDYFIAALRTLRPNTGETALALLHSPQSYSAESVLTALINDITDISDDFVIVLDDYQLIKAEPIHSAIVFLLEHMPPRMHLVIATRADPPLHLSRLRGRGTMVEIGADDLRFTVEETAALLKAQHLELPDEDISTLNARTEGWAVGLTMAGLSLGKNKDVPGFIAAFSGSQRHVMDYLVEEVLRQQPSELQLFLLQTSVLERLTAGLCDYVTERHGSREMLENLASAFGGFLIPLDEARQWYRYQHLFAGLLRHQAEMHNSEEQMRVLHQRASQWFEEHSLPDEAVHHALAARDWQRAMLLISGASERLVNGGQWLTLLSWFSMVPDQLLRSVPRLYSRYAGVLINLGQFEAAETALSYLEKNAQGDTSLQGELAVFQMNLATLRGNTARILESAETALRLLPPDNLTMRARASYMLGWVHMNRVHLDEAESFIKEAYELARQAGDYVNGAGSACYLGVVLWLRGKLGQAQEMIQHGVALAGQLPASAGPR